jgi:23S rRNA (guanosine2251-2'-O)-methyltransferase
MRKSIAGPEHIAAALAAGEPVRLVLIQRDEGDPDLLALAARAELAGAIIWRGGPGDLERMSHGAGTERVLALVGPPLVVDLEALCARRGALWLLHRAAYPSNVGFAVRTAEVSGAEGVVVDAHFNHDERSRVSHVSMGADRVMPVLWASTEATLTAARAAGLRVVALEAIDHPRARPVWEIDLTGGVLLIAGNERDGLNPDLVARCDDLASIPMAGFVPSYNLHAAIAAVAAERLRQLATRSRET